MKTIFVALVCAAFCLSCSKINNISMMEAKKSLPFEAMVENIRLHGVRGPDSSEYLAADIMLRQTNGTVLLISESRLDLTQLAFAASLIKGRSYEFPAAITDFESDLKRKRLEGGQHAGAKGRSQPQGLERDLWVPC